MAKKMTTRTAKADLERELAESRAYHAALDEVLHLISQSPHDPQPVFDTIARLAVTLCNGTVAFTTHFDGEQIHLKGYYGLEKKSERAVRKVFPRQADNTTLHGRAILARQVIQIDDLSREDQNPITRAITQTDVRSVLVVPMFHQGSVIGTLGVSRAEPGAFSEPLIKLLQSFAAQAAITIENVRLFNETRQALEQQTVSGEVLRVVSSSVADATPVFEKIVESCDRLLVTDFTAVWLQDEHRQMRLAAIRTNLVNPSEVPTAIPANHSLFGFAQRCGRAVQFLTRDELVFDDAGVQVTEEDISANDRLWINTLGDHSLVVTPLVRTVWIIERAAKAVPRLITAYLVQEKNHGDN